MSNSSESPTNPLVPAERVIDNPQSWSELVGRIEESTSTAYQRFQAGNSPSALALLHQAREWGERLPDRKRLCLAYLMNALGTINLYVGNYTAAIKNFEDGIVFWRESDETGPADVHLSFLLMAHYAAAHDRIGDFRRADEIWTDIAALGPGSERYLPHEARVELLKLEATHHRLVRDFDRAERNLMAVLELQRAAKDETRESQPWLDAELAHDLAWIYRMTGRRAAARSLLQESLERMRSAAAQAGGPSAARLANVLSSLGTFELESGDPHVAAAHLQEAINIKEALHGEGHPSLIDSLMSLGEAFFAVGEMERSHESLSAAARIEGESLRGVLGPLSDRQRARVLSVALRNTHAVCSAALRAPHNKSAFAGSALDLLLARKALSIDVLSYQRRMLLTSDEPSIRRGVDELSQLWSRMTRHSWAHENGGNVEERLAFQAMEASARRLETQLAGTVFQADVQIGRDLDWRAVAAALAPGEAVVEFAKIYELGFAANLDAGAKRWLPARYIAFVLRCGTEAPVLVDLGRAIRIEQLVATFREFVVARPRRRDWARLAEHRRVTLSAAGEELRTAVLDPLKPALDGCSRLFLAPDDSLFLVPFEALPTVRGFVVDEYRISYLTSGRDLVSARTDTPGRKTKPAVVVAAPDFDLSAGLLFRLRERLRHLRSVPKRRFERLPGARREGRTVARMLGIEPLLGRHATSENVKKVKSPSILHFATHGFFVPSASGGSSEYLESSNDSTVERYEDPLLRSGLALAGANLLSSDCATADVAGHGVLTAMDVAGMDLQQTDLVVLSACETGLGSLRMGDGILGLRRSFRAAGARSIIMSLWKVPDSATSQLFRDFYSILREGKSRQAALVEAQLQMRTRHPDILYWGAFVLEGETGVIRQDHLT